MLTKILTTVKKTPKFLAKSAVFISLSKTARGKRLINFCDFDPMRKNSVLLGLSFSLDWGIQADTPVIQLWIIFSDSTKWIIESPPSKHEMLAQRWFAVGPTWCVKCNVVARPPWRTKRSVSERCWVVWSSVIRWICRPTPMIHVKNPTWNTHQKEI